MTELTRRTFLKVSALFAALAAAMPTKAVAQISGADPKGLILARIKATSFKDMATEAGYFTPGKPPAMGAGRPAEWYRGKDLRQAEARDWCAAKARMAGNFPYKPKTGMEYDGEGTELYLRWIDRETLQEVHREDMGYVSGPITGGDDLHQIGKRWVILLSTWIDSQNVEVIPEYNSKKSMLQKELRDKEELEWLKEKDGGRKK